MDVMKRLVVACALWMALSPASVADTASDFGRAASAWNPQISPDGTRLAMGCSPNGERTVCIYSFDGAPTRVFSAADDESDRDDRWISGHYWASADHLIVNLIVADTRRTSRGIDGYLMSRAASFNVTNGSTAMLMRDQRNYTRLTNLNSRCVALPDTVAMEISVRARRGGLRTALRTVDLNTGRSRSLDDGDPQSVLTHIFNDKFEPIVRILFDERQHTFGVQLIEGRETIYSVENVIVPPMGVVGLDETGDALVVRVDLPGMTGLYELSLSDGTLSPVLHDGEHIGDPAAIVDAHTNALVGFAYTQDLHMQEFSDSLLDEVHQALQGALPDHIIRLVSWSRDRTKYTVAAERPGYPVDFYLFDTAAGSIAPLSNEAPEHAGRVLSVPQSVSYTARDGLEIPAYLTLPPGKTRADGPFPLVLMPHGGPESRDTARFDWWAQAVATEGYAVLQPNFRGSNGYGPAFRDAGFGEFGDQMIFDILDGAYWLEGEGIAAPGGACIAGASYGGYAALMAPLHDRDLIQCSVAVSAVTDVFVMMGDAGIGSGTYNYWLRYVGQGVYDDEEELARLTPKDRTHQYSAPVLMIHGTRDYVVDITHAEGFKRYWGERDGLRYVEMEGEGHDLLTTNARQTVLRETLSFLAAHHPAR